MSGELIPKNRYYQIIKDTQLISVDLIIKCHIKGVCRYLFGRRINKPAQNFLFVPGSRICKNETIVQGLHRVVKDELGLESPFLYKNLGVFEHIYNDNFVDDSFGTHYVVFTYEIEIDSPDQIISTQFYQQHQEIVWLTTNEILTRSDVHEYCKYYFLAKPPNQVGQSDVIKEKSSPLPVFRQSNVIKEKSSLPPFYRLPYCD